MTEELSASGGQWKIVPQRRSDRAITGDRVAGHKHLPEQPFDAPLVSIRTPRLDAITSPCACPISTQLRAQHLCRLPVAHPSAMSLGSEAKQVIADSSGKNVGGRASAPAIERHCTVEGG